MAVRRHPRQHPIAILSAGLLVGVVVFCLVVVAASGTRTTMLFGLPAATVLGVGAAVATVLVLKRHRFR
ncbi:hypothetical protein [Haloarchaeobius sp. DFWS5]|uniref:hypothetical protein n=1 Tax=Haloarchaeobius sp. DFWS5 TaxID=3446114 RepID=UPI003EBA67DF